MAWLNYHHLYYFWLVVREGTIAGAAKVLRLSEPTVSAQVHELERTLEVKLFERDGRHLVVTAAGRLAYRYANEIFLLGREFQAAIGGTAVGKAARLVVGVADQVPRLIVFRLLEPALQADVRFNLVCQTETPEQLLAKLVNHEIDVVISDAPLEGPGKVRTHSHLLGECGVTVFGSDELAAKYRRGFPHSLNGAPFLLPAENSALRRSLERWFDGLGVEPRIRGEFTDSTLLKTFGRASVGLFAAPSAIEREVRREYRVRVVGRVEAVRERFFVVSAKRKTRHHGVAAISHSARTGLFS